MLMTGLLVVLKRERESVRERESRRKRERERERHYVLRKYKTQ